MTGLVDSHAHLMDSAFDADRAEVFARAAEAGVEKLLIVGYDRASSEAAIELAHRFSVRAEFAEARIVVAAAVGIHPNSAAEAEASDWARVAELARDPVVVAIGETGLDNYRHHTPPSQQRTALGWHARLANDLDLPLIIHNRDADADVADALASSASKGVLHCFSSTDPSYLERMLAAGFFVSFAGTLTYRNAADLRLMAARVPLDRLLSETDCPYLAPVPHRGRRNEPAFVRHTAECLASIHDLSTDALADHLSANFTRLFAKQRVTAQ